MKKFHFFFVLFFLNVIYANFAFSLNIGTSVKCYYSDNVKSRFEKIKVDLDHVFVQATNMYFTKSVKTDSRYGYNFTVAGTYKYN